MTATATEAVDVPKTVIDAVIAVYATAALHGRDLDPDIVNALRAIVDRDLPGGTTAGTVRIDAETAWWLADCGDALDVYNLDENDPGVWEHPSVAAQQQLADIVDQQAPAVAARLNAQLEQATL